MSKKCLVIDDVEVSRYVIGESVREFGFEYKEAEDGQQALEQLKKDKFDVIFLDWHLRKSDGLSLIPDIKKIPHSQNTPIIVCTGVEMEKELSEIRSQGVQGLLKKPTTPDKIKEELRRLSLL